MNYRRFTIDRTSRAPWGELLLAREPDEPGLAGIWFGGQKYAPALDEHWQAAEEDPLLQQAERQLRAYFDGQKVAFDVPLSLRGTDFQHTVWQGLLNIPRGHTLTYGELARSLGRPTSVRAVAAAVGRNPASVVVPCHRVLGGNGKLTGYAGGLARKQALLELEGALVAA